MSISGYTKGAGGAREDRQWLGTYSASVAVATDPTNQGRVRLYVPQVLGNATSAWAVPMQPGLKPAQGSQVYCTFLGGNPDLPQYFLGLTAKVLQQLTSNTGLVLNPNPYMTGGVITQYSGTNGSVTANTPNSDTNPPYTDAVLLTSAGTGGSSINESNDPINVQPNQPYQVTAWVYYPAGGNVTTGMNFSDSGGGALAPQTTTTAVPASTWTQVTSTITSPASSATGYATIGPATSSTGQQFTAQAIQVIGSIPGSLITPNTITIDQLASNLIVAGIVDGTTITGATVVADGNSGELLCYSGTPATGNLIFSVSPTAGTDVYGNSYPAGGQYGITGESQVLLDPTANAPFDITTTILGTLTAMVQTSTPDTNQVFPGIFGAAVLGTGTGSKMSSVMSSPLGTGSGACVVLQAENDANTDTAIVTLGTYASPDGMTMVFTPIATFTPYAFVLYGGSSGQTIVSKTSGSGTIPIPGGITTVKAEAWGTGGGADNEGGSGGGGEYACESSLAVGSTVAYSIGTPGSGGAFDTNHYHSGGNGGSTTITGSSVTVTAHGGGGSKFAGPGAGGTGSTNTVHFDGGDGATGNGMAGAGGGSSAGSASAGRDAVDITSSTQTAGGTGANAPAGGGSGGNGGSGVHTGGSGLATAGSNGHGPGGGGGGGGQNNNNGNDNLGGSGGSGQVSITYSSGPPPIEYSIATSAFTDQFGNSVGVGVYSGSAITVANSGAPGTASSAGPTLYGSTANSLGIQKPNNYAGALVSVQSDIAQHTVTSSGFNNLSVLWGIAANDAVTGTVYRLTCWGNGNVGSSPVGLSWQLGGTLSGQAQFAVPSTISVASHPSIYFQATAIIMVVSSTTAVGSLAVNIGSGNTTTGQFASGNGAGFSTATTWAVSSAQTLSIQCAWASTAGSPTITGYGSMLETLSR